MSFERSFLRTRIMAARHRVSGVHRYFLPLLVAAAAGLPWASSSAEAADHAPPKVVARTSERRLQRGVLGSYCWLSHVSGDEYRRECIDREANFPAAARVDPGKRIRIRLKKAQKPEVRIRVWHRLDGNGTPYGTGKRLDYKLKAHYKDGEIVARDAVISLPKSKMHFFLRVVGHWHDEEGAGGDQDAEYLFHLKSRRCARN